MKTTTLTPWYGSNRTLAANVGARLSGCKWVAVPFAGGMCELAHVNARTLLVNDQHRHLINLATVLACPYSGPALIRSLRRQPFHPDRLALAQERCRAIDAGTAHPLGRAAWAEDYFVCCWMTRSGLAGTPGEFSSGLSVRYDAGGGDSAVRFRSAVESLRAWRRIFARCTFVCGDAFELLGKVNDEHGHGIYADPPFPDAGARYTHNPGRAGSETERVFHVRLRDQLVSFERASVVVRFYDHPLVRELYPETVWTWERFTGRKQTNEIATEEVLLVRNLTDGAQARESAASTRAPR